MLSYLQQTWSVIAADLDGVFEINRGASSKKIKQIDWIFAQLVLNNRVALLIWPFDKLRFDQKGQWKKIIVEWAGNIRFKTL